jgi:hypothetical protein
MGCLKCGWDKKRTEGLTMRVFRVRAACTAGHEVGEQ